MADAVETGTIDEIGIGAEEPTDLEAVTFSFSSIARGGDASLAAGSVQFKRIEDGIELKAPLDQIRKGFIPIDHGIDGFSFSTYSHLSAASLAIIESVANGEAGTSGPSITYRSIYVHYVGLGYRVFPRVVIKLGENTAGIRELSTTTFEVMVCQPSVSYCGAMNCEGGYYDIDEESGS